MDVDGGVAHKQLTPLSEALYHIWAPRAFTFVHQPLSKLKAPEKEYEILRESILVQIVIKAEEADTHGTRKAGLIKKKIITDVQEVVGGCDEVMQNPPPKPGSSTRRCKTHEQRERAYAAICAVLHRQAS